MKLRQTIYKNIEMVVDEDGGMAIGNIVVDSDDKFVFAEILDNTIYDHKELKKVRAFLDEVEKMMTPVATSIFSLSGADVTSRSVEMDIRCK